MPQGILLVELYDTTAFNTCQVFQIIQKGVIGIDRTWISAVRTHLYLCGKTQKDMAEDLGVSYQYVRGVMCGKYESEKIIEKIEAYCGMNT